MLLRVILLGLLLLVVELLRLLELYFYAHGVVIIQSVVSAIGALSSRDDIWYELFCLLLLHVGLWERDWLSLRRGRNVRVGSSFSASMGHVGLVLRLLGH